MLHVHDVGSKAAMPLQWVQPSQVGDDALAVHVVNHRAVLRNLLLVE